MLLRHRLSRSVALTAIATVVVLSSAPDAGAQRKNAVVPAAAPAVKPLGESLTGPARDDYEAARTLYEQNDFAGAGAKLQQAYDRSKDPRLLWNIASCEKNLRHYARVEALLTRYLSEGHSVLTKENEAEARAVLAAVHQFVSPLDLTVNEAGALVFVDDQQAATTPLQAPIPVDVGTHQLRITKSGFKPFVQDLTVGGGAPMKVTATLAPSVARLVVVTADTNVVSIDGKVAGSGRVEMSLPPGTHAVRVAAEGRTPQESQVDLAGDDARTMQIALERTGGKPVWPWIAGGVALAAGATVGAIFIFKSKDPEGSAPSGSLAPNTVQFSGWRFP